MQILVDSVLLAQQALQLAKDLHFPMGEQQAQNVLGNAFNSVGNYPKALVAYFAALKIAETMHDAEHAARVLNNIANYI